LIESGIRADFKEKSAFCFLAISPGLTDVSTLVEPRETRKILWY